MKKTNDEIVELRKAAEQGDAKAMYNLGACYFDGTGVKRDEAEAMKWCRKAAELGHEMAKETLSLLPEE